MSPGSILMFFKPKNTITVPMTLNYLLLNLYRDAEVTRKEVIDIMANLPQIINILI